MRLTAQSIPEAPTFAVTSDRRLALHWSLANLIAAVDSPIAEDETVLTAATSGREPVALNARDLATEVAAGSHRSSQHSVNFGTRHPPAVPAFKTSTQAD